MLVTAGIFGLIASSLMGAKRMNFVLLVLLGFAGAWLGSWIQGFFHLPALWSIQVGLRTFPIIWTTLGCVCIVGIFSFMFQR